MAKLGEATVYYTLSKSDLLHLEGAINLAIDGSPDGCCSTC